MRRMSIGWALATLVACSGQTTQDKTPGDANTDVGTDSATTETGYVFDSAPTEDVSARLEGAVYRGDGSPFEGAQLRFCRGAVCRNGETAPDGTYEFGAVAVDWFSFEVVGERGQVTAFVPLQFESEQTRSVDLYVQDAVETAIPRARAVLDVAPGLRIEVGEGDLEEVPLEDPATDVLAAQIPMAQWVPTDGLPGTVVGQWSLGPFDFPASDPDGLPTSFENPAGLPEGTTLHAYVGSYESSRWEDLGTVTTGASGWTTTAGLTLLSTVVLLQE